MTAWISRIGLADFEMEAEALLAPVSVQSASRAIIHDVIGRQHPTVTFVGSGGTDGQTALTGTFDLLVGSAARAIAAVQFVCEAGIYRMVTDDAAWLTPITFAVAGEVRAEQQTVHGGEDGIGKWIVRIPFVEVESVNTAL